MQVKSAMAPYLDPILASVKEGLQQRGYAFERFAIHPLKS